MNDKLNEQYKQTRDSHTKQVSKKAWLLVIPVLIVFIIIGTIATETTERINPIKTERSVDDMMMESLAQSHTILNPRTIILEYLNLSVFMHSGITYTRFEDKNSMFAYASDGSSLLYIISELANSKGPEDSMNIWTSSLSKGKDKYVFEETEDETFILVELVNEDGNHKGFANSFSFGKRHYIFQCVILSEYFDEYEDNMYQVMNSLQPYKKKYDN